MPFPETTLLNNIVVPTVILTWLMYAGMTALFYFVYKQFKHLF